MFETAEFPPGGVEFPGHTHEIVLFQIAAEGGKKRIVVISPPAGGKRFQFQMTEIGQQIPVSGSQQSAVVVEHVPVRIDTTGGFGGLFQIFDQCTAGKTLTVGRIFGIVPFFFHIPHTPGATAFPLTDDIKEHPVGIREHPGSFFDLPAEVIQIRGVEAHGLESGT